MVLISRKNTTEVIFARIFPPGDLSKTTIWRAKPRRLEEPLFSEYSRQVMPE